MKHILKNLRLKKYLFLILIIKNNQIHMSFSTKVRFRKEKLKYAKNNHNFSNKILII